MRRKLVVATSALVLLAGAGIARAGTIPVLAAQFTTPGDLAAFTKVSGEKCTAKQRALAKGGAMGINVLAPTPECIYRTSVVSSSDDTSPGHDIQAAAGYEKKTPAPLLSKLFLSLRVRANATSFYELRVIPTKRTWQVIRDPEGTEGPAVMQSGVAKFIKPGPGGAKTKAPANPPANTTNPTTPAKIAVTRPGADEAPARTPARKKKKPASSKLNVLRLIATPSGAGAAITASINDKTVFTTTDVAPMPPAGRFTQIGIGNKTGADAGGMLGTFDDVTVRLP